MKAKKQTAALLILLLLAAFLFGCGRTANSSGQGGNEPDVRSDPENITLSVVAATFPLYDWAREITNGKTDLRILSDSGIDLHSFQPSAQDLVTLTSCDLLLYVGGESDFWIRDALKNPVNPDIRAVSLMDLLGSEAKEEELREGMQAEEEDSGDGETDGPELDEHVWLSLRNAQFFVEKIAEIMAELDEKHAAVYRKNAENYIGKLSGLDQKYTETIENSTQKTILLADRFPFRYLVDDYGLSYYAAFQGCSAESDASFETVLFLAEKLRELSLPCVLVIENSDQKLAKTVCETAECPDCPIFVLNSIQSVTADEISHGTDYLGIMEDNLGVLKEALR